MVLLGMGCDVVGKSTVATSVGPCQVDDDDDDNGGACESGGWRGFPRALGDDDEDFESL